MNEEMIKDRLREAETNNQSCLVEFVAAKSGRLIKWRCSVLGLFGGTTRSLGGMKSGKLGDDFVRVECAMGKRTIDISTIRGVY